MDEEIKNMLAQNLKMTQEIYSITKKIHRNMIWQQVFGFIKVLIILIPVILGIMYLPPLLEQVIKQYNDLAGMNDVKNQINPELFKSLTPDILNKIKK
jgi:hypothetical protein